jgi:hypothetical protein
MARQDRSVIRSRTRSSWEILDGRRRRRKTGETCRILLAFSTICFEDSDFQKMDIRLPEHTASVVAQPKPRYRTLLQLAAWGTCAALSVGTLVVVVESPAGGQRLASAMAGGNEAARSAPAAAPSQPDPLVKALEARIASLTSDRDRLASRVAALESGFEDLTGSVRRQAAQAAKPSPVAPLPEPVQAVEAKAPAPMVVAVAPPLINPLATPPAGVASILPELPAAKAAPAPPETGAAEATTSSTAAPETESSEGTPLPPERVAEAEPAQAAKPAAVAARGRAEFGIELAIEPSMDGLRKRWAAVKANYGPLLVGLSPVAVRDQHPGSSAVRLVAGPLPNLTAARRLCARFAAMNGDCWPARINPADVVQR